MSPQTAEALDRDGFTPAEQAYFASQGQNTDGLVEDAPDTPASDAAIPDPAIDNGAVADVAAVVPDPNADPFDDLEKSAKPTRDKTGRVIPEANFRVVSEKYKATKAELADFKKKLEEIEAGRTTDRAELAKEREMRTRIDERLKLFNEVIAPQAGADPQQPAPMPNPEENLFEAFNWAIAKLNDLEGKIGQTTQTIQHTEAETQLRTTYQADAQRFMGETPDFASAYQHVNRVRDAMLQEIGYSDPNQRAQIRMDEERALVDQALRSGKSPAATIYGVAKSLGYVKAAPVAAAAAAAPAAAPAASAAPSVTEEVERIAKAQAASKSLSSGGGASVGPMTVETLANMTDPEFEAYARKNPNVVKELMGG
jgi:hypothetical protein